MVCTGNLKIPVTSCFLLFYTPSMHLFCLIFLKFVVYFFCIKKIVFIICKNFVFIWFNMTSYFYKISFKIILFSSYLFLMLLILILNIYFYFVIVIFFFFNISYVKIMCVWTTRWRRSVLWVFIVLLSLKMLKCPISHFSIFGFICFQISIFYYFWSFI